MDLSLAQFLVSPTGVAATNEAVALLRERVDTLTGITRLRRTLSAEEAGAVWKAGQLSMGASEKLGDIGSVLVFDQDGYEMSSGLVASEYHANRIAASGAQNVLDLCGGTGLDSIAFAKKGITVTVFEQDPARATLLAENIRRTGFDSLITLRQEDVSIASLPQADAAFFDPARRSGSRRWVSDDEGTVPPLSFIDRVLISSTPNIMAKLSPAVDRGLGSRFDGTLEIISVKGDCKEALLGLGVFANGPGMTAVLLPQNDRYSEIYPTRIDSSHGAYINEPNSAIIRAGLTGSLASSLSGWLCDPHVDYFFTDEPVSSPFATCYRVLTELVYSRQALQRALAGNGKVVFKQRGFQQSIDDVSSKLKLSGKGTGLVILAGFNGQSFAFVVERMV